MADYGMKISKAGFDVKTADIDDLILHSEHYGIKIVAEGVVSFSVTSGSGGSGGLEHGLNYTPAFMAFLTGGTGKAFPPSSWDYDKNYEQFVAQSGPDTLNFSIDANANSNYTAYVYYYIFAEVAQ